MSEHYVARCDAPNCTKEEPLIAMALTGQWTNTGSMPAIGYTFALPAGWRRVESAIVCSWACLAAYSANQAEQGRR